MNNSQLRSLKRSSKECSARGMSVRVVDFDSQLDVVWVVTLDNPDDLIEVSKSEIKEK